MTHRSGLKHCSALTSHELAVGRKPTPAAEPLCCTAVALHQWAREFPEVVGLPGLAVAAADAVAASPGDWPYAAMIARFAPGGWIGSSRPPP